MELYIRDTLNGVLIENKVSLFGDEEIKLTKKWNDVQVIAGYGSFSQSFSVPIDANNAKIFKYYDIIGGFYVQNTGFTNNSFNPNYFLPARIIINEFEIIGNIQVVGFSTVDDERYAYQLTFFGEEKNLIRDLNASDFPKLNDMILSDIDFTLNFENVISTWTGTNTMHFVPLIATKKPLNYRDDKQIGNINSSATNTATFTGTTGVDMTNLTVTYNLQQILERMLITNNIQLSATTNVYTFLENLYVGINTKVDYAGGDLTYVYTEAEYANTVTLSGSSYNKLNMTTSSLTQNGIINGNTDLISWNNIADYANSDDTYTAQSSGDYSFTLTIKQLVDQVSIMNVTTHRVKIVDVTTGAVLFSTANTTAPRTITATIPLSAGQKIMFLVNYQFKSFIFLNGNFQITYYDGVYYDDQISCTIKAQLVSAASYNIRKSTINFPDMLMSDFFVHFCKSFNIMFIYEDLEVIDTTVYRFVGTWSGGTIGTLYETNDVVEYNGSLYLCNSTHISSAGSPPPNTHFDLTDNSVLYPRAKSKVTMYFKEELPSTIYELDNYLLLDKSYTYNTDPKYKFINWKFADAKDINNITWKNSSQNGYTQLGSTNVGGLAFGELKTYYNYDVGIDKNEYKSIFTVFPRTTLNYTDNDNIILSGTEIVLHSELNESLSEIQTDFLLMYRNQMITGIDHPYNIQSSATGYTEIDYVADYSANGGNGYILDYNEFPNAIKDNVTNKFRVTLEFKLSPQILYNIKVYDIIVVRGIWYEIVEMNIDIKTGHAQMTLISTTYRRSGDIEAVEPTTTTTTTAPTTTTTTTGSVAQLVFNFVGTTGNIYMWGINAGDVILSDTDVFGINTILKDFGTDITSFPHVLTNNLIYWTNPPIVVTGYTDHFYASIDGVYTYVTVNWSRT